MANTIIENIEKIEVNESFDKLLNRAAFNFAQKIYWNFVYFTNLQTTTKVV